MMLPILKANDNSDKDIWCDDEHIRVSELFSEENQRREEVLQETQKDLDILVKILTMMMILM